MKSLIWIILITLIVVLMGLLYSKASVNQPPEEVQTINIPFERINLSTMTTDSNLSKAISAVPAQRRIFTDFETWDLFWRKYGCEPPKFEFEGKWIAAVFRGAKSNPGYGVKIQNVSVDRVAGKTTIKIVEWDSNISSMLPQVVVYPADFVTFRRLVDFEVIKN
jgi:hypothetical protein